MPQSESLATLAVAAALRRPRSPLNPRITNSYPEPDPARHRQRAGSGPDIHRARAVGTALQVVEPAIVVDARPVWPALSAEIVARSPATATPGS